MIGGVCLFEYIAEPIFIGLYTYEKNTVLQPTREGRNSRHSVVGGGSGQKWWF